MSNSNDEMTDIVTASSGLLELGKDISVIEKVKRSLHCGGTSHQR